MEYGSIEREFQVDASPEVVFEVISSPEHICDWWSADGVVEAREGFVGELAWADGDTPRAHVSPITVVKADPPHVFAFRWVYEDGVAPAPGTSLLVTFELVPSGAGTVVKFSETGFREMGWEIAKLEDVYNDHTSGWDAFLPRLAEVAALVGAPQ
jgi:uncharacterized protein YndB with AHSA1/START domain